MYSIYDKTANNNMESSLTGLVLFCTLFALTACVAPPSEADIECITNVAVRDNLDGCSTLLTTNVNVSS